MLRIREAGSYGHTRLEAIIKGRTDYTQVTKLYGSPTYFPVFRAIRIQLLHKKVENTLILRGIDVIGEFFDVDSTSHLYKFQPTSSPIYD